MICGHIPDGYEEKLRQRRADHAALTRAEKMPGVLRGQQCGWPAPAQCLHMIVTCSVKADFDSE